jgi:hypothetical protein
MIGGGETADPFIVVPLGRFCQAEVDNDYKSNFTGRRNMLREIQIYGSWAARDVTTGQVVDKHKAYSRDPGTTRCPIPLLCRLLKRKGLASDDDTIRVFRGTMQIFNDLPLKWWADRDCVETRNRNVHWTWYKPFIGIPAADVRAGEDKQPAAW